MSSQKMKDKTRWSDGSAKANKQRRTDNDPFWYAMDAMSLKDMASLPWNTVVGSNLSGFSDGHDSVPGILIANVKQACGSFRADDFNNNADRSASVFYNAFTQGFTSGVNFEAPDVFMSAVAGASAFSLMLAGRRILGLMHYFLQLNPYWARHIIRGLGFDFDDWKRNLANARSEYNLRVASMNKSIAVPADFALLKKWCWMNTYLYTDTSSPEYSSAIAYKTTHYMKYDAISATTGTCLRWTECVPASLTPSSLLKVEDFFLAVDELCDALNDDDVREMYGALRRVYPDSSLYKLDPVTESYITTVDRNDIIAAAFHNMKWIPDTLNGITVGRLPASITANSVSRYDVPVHQDADGNIISEISWRAATTDISTESRFLETLLSGGKTLIDVYDHQSTPEVVLDVSATMCVPTRKFLDPAGTQRMMYSITCRDHIVSNMFLLSSSETSTAKEASVFNIYPYYVPNLMPAYFSTLLRFMHVDSHPLIPCFTNGSTGSEFSGFLGYAGEIDKSTLITNNDLKLLNDRAMWKMLLLPIATKSTT